MSLADVIPDLAEWLAGLSPEFAFLLALPVIVALAGLLRYAACRAREPRRDLSVPAAPSPAARFARER